MNKKFALQLYSLRDLMESDYAPVIEQVAEFGYNGVELYNIGQFALDKIKPLLEKTKLCAFSAHVSKEELGADKLHKTLSYLRDIGAKYAICPYAEMKTVQEIEAVADILNAAATAAKKYGITVGYHNHGHEFEKLGNEYVLEYLMSKTASDIVFELDVFWVQHSGVNPIDFYEKHKDRIKLLHLKQIDANNKAVDLSGGVIDMKRLCETDCELIVEQEDYAVSSLESAKNNAIYMKEILK